MTLHSMFMENTFAEILLQEAPVSIALIDKNGYVITCSKQWKNEFDHHDTESISVFELFKTHASFWIAAFEHCETNQQEVYSSEIEWNKELGDVRFLQIEVKSWNHPAKHISGYLISTHDISAKSKLELNALQLAAIVEASEDAIIRKDLNSIVLTWNKGAEKIFGFTAAEMIGKNIREIIPTEKESDEDYILSNMKKGLSISQFETTRKTKQGQLIEVAITISPIKNNNGEIIGIAKVVREISKIKSSEKLLKESEERFRKAFDNAAIGMALVGLDGSWIKVNDSLCKSLGYTKDELYQLTFQDITHPEDLDIDLGLMQEVLRGERDSYQLEKRYIHKNGSIVWIILAGSIICDANDKPLYFVSQITDISPRKIAEKKLAETTQQLQSVLNTNTKVSIIGTDLHGVINLFSKGAENMLGYQAQEMLGQKTPVAFHDIEEVDNRSRELSMQYGKDITGFDVFVERARNGIIESRDWTYIRKDGSKFPVQLVVSAVKNSASEIIGYIGVGIDISELKIAKENAEQLAAEKERFLANMSHEIRTPLNGMLGFTKVLSQTHLDQDQREYLSAVQVSGENLLLLINDILDYSKIQAGMMSLEQKPFRLKILIENLSLILQKQFTNKNLDFNVQYDSAIPQTICGDELRLTQILSNLLSNAIKFTDTGTVSLNIHLQELSKTNAKIRFDVCDTGIGIAPEKQTLVFERFSQANSDTTRKYGGTGLGLTIVNSLLELHDSSIKLESELGKGSKFSFEINYLLTSQQALTISKHDNKADTTNNTGLNILLAEDNRINQKLASIILSKFGHQITIAENGLEAIAKLKQKQFDLILMDMQMPEMDGYEATVKIRTELHNNIPIVAITAHALQGEREKCLNLGMNDYISKPFDPEKLKSVIDEVMEKQSTLL